MNPVVGLDSSKGESILEEGKPHRKSFSVSHTIEGLDCLVDYLEELEN
ncbi:hypothetical protein ACK1LH_01510 [Metabacillus indicus]